MVSCFLSGLNENTLRFDSNFNTRSDNKFEANLASQNGQKNMKIMI